MSPSYSMLFLVACSLLFACNNNSTTTSETATTTPTDSLSDTPETSTELTLTDYFPFGHDLSTFQVSVNKLEGGDCWGTVRQYTKDNWLVIVDTTQCSEYSTSYHYYLIKDRELVRSQSMTLFNDFDAEQNKAVTILADERYVFDAAVPTFTKWTKNVSGNKTFPQDRVLAPQPFEDHAKVRADMTSMLAEYNNLTAEESTGTFTLSQKVVRLIDGVDPPLVKIYLHTDWQPEPFFIGEDYNLQELESAEDKADYKIPSVAVFSFRSWYAGGGAIYYGLVKNNILYVYRKYEEEQAAQDAFKFELIKRFNYPTKQSVDHYICYQGDQDPNNRFMVAFGPVKALYAKYQGDPATQYDLLLVKDHMSTEGAYPVTEGEYYMFVEEKVYGRIVLTHSGIWDYAVLKANDSETEEAFTIDHETSVEHDAYLKRPCF